MQKVEQDVHEMSFSYLMCLLCLVGSGLPSFSAEMYVGYYPVSMTSVFLALRIFYIRAHNLFRRIYFQHIFFLKKETSFLYSDIVSNYRSMNFEVWKAHQDLKKWR